MAKIPRQNEIQDLVESGTITEEPRPHLGYSQMGGACDRKLYYILRWAFKQKINKRQQRIFRRGDLEEDRVYKDLADANFSIKNPQRKVKGAHGHILGHTDGEVNGPTLAIDDTLVEIKTMNQKRYSEYLNKGLRVTNPAYYSQINSYMGKCNLSQCLFIVANKNTEERSYILIPFDKEEYERIESRGLSILYSEFAPKRIGKKTWFECKFCDAKGVCHNDEPIEVNCRTCKYVAIIEDGKWECNHEKFYEVLNAATDMVHTNTVSLYRQRTGCELYELDTESFDV